MEGQSEERWETRHEQLSERIAAIEGRLRELRQAEQERRYPAACSEHMVEAQHHAAVSETAAQRAFAASTAPA